MTIELTSISAASNNPITQMLVNGILNDDQQAVNVAQGAIRARGEMAQIPEYKANIDRIASGLNNMGVTMDKGPATGRA